MSMALLYQIELIPQKKPANAPHNNVVIGVAFM